MHCKHIYDLQRIKPGQPSKWHVITDGIVISSHRSESTALKAKGQNPHYHVYRQDPLAPGAYYSSDRGLTFVS